MSKRKALDISGKPNQDLCEILIELADYERNVSKNIYKYNAYRQAASRLAELPERIKSGKEARNIKGIGEIIAKKIDEFLQTGKLQKLERIHREENICAIEVLTRVSGIGTAKAKEFIDLGIKSLEDLFLNQDKLNHHQKIGLKHFADFERIIPWQEIRELDLLIKKTLVQTDNDIIMTACGSYRRGEDQNGLIDIVITHPIITSKDRGESGDLLKKIVKVLTNKNIITDTMALGDIKFVGVCKLSNEKPFRRLDITMVPFDQYYCFILYSTGSSSFMKDMRKKAQEEKYKLSEYDLRKYSPEGLFLEPEKITSEEDIFEVLNLAYKKPEERNV